MPKFQLPPALTLRKKSRLSIVYVFMILIALLIGIFGYYFFQKQQFVSTAESEATELKQVVAKLGKLMELPKDETPVLATVTDREQIKSQAFFARSENGDKVLIYTKFGRAILYRPSVNKIIDITIINTTNVPTFPTTSQ